jgi:hypothetical protein
MKTKNLNAANEFIEKSNQWTRDMRAFLESREEYDDVESALFLRSVQDAVNRFMCRGC